MKLTKKLMIWCGIVVVGCATLYAVTEQWRYTVDGEIIQVLSDGKGGCAIAHLVTADVLRVEWFDKNGILLYDTGPMKETFPLGGFGGPIHECTPKQIVLTCSYFLPVLLQVKRNGTELPAFDIRGIVLGFPYNEGVPVVFPSSRFTDKKGLFVINVNTNTDENTLVRYSYK